MLKAWKLNLCKFLLLHYHHYDSLIVTKYYPENVIVEKTIKAEKSNLILERYIKNGLQRTWKL